MAQVKDLWQLGELLRDIMIFKKIKILSNISVVFLISFFSCKRCDKEMYFHKFYLYSGLQIKLEINDMEVYDQIFSQYYIPNIKKPSSYCPNLCTSVLKDDLIKVKYQINERDTVFYLDRSKIEGVLLGYEVSEDKINIIVDSIGMGLFWDGKPTGFD